MHHDLVDCGRRVKYAFGDGGGNAKNRFDHPIGFGYSKF